MDNKGVILFARAVETFGVLMGMTANNQVRDFKYPASDFFKVSQGLAEEIAALQEENDG